MGAVSEPTRFDLTSELPVGVTVLEASAGTGKTYTIAALATRFIAEGASLDEMLLVTFTRLATGELRERVRERLVSTERALADALAGVVPEDDDDQILKLLLEGDPAAVEQRRNRLARAISNFDAATIETTHGFCQKVLAELGTLADLEPDVTFTESVDELATEVVDDLYVRRFYDAVDIPIGRRQAGEVAKIAIDNPTSIVYPRTKSGDSPRAMRGRLAQAARDELERRKRRLALMTFSDQLTRLQKTLQGPNGTDAIARLRRRYRYVLIDEFQDTDPIQWDIVERAFGGGDVRLVLIADPKQAIYAFRGADVHAYLQAAQTAAVESTLATNHRSDQTLLDGFDALFGHARLGHERIAYRRVAAAPGNRLPRLHGAPTGRALRIRVLDRGDVDQNQWGQAYPGSATAHIARDVAGEVVSLLSSGARIEQRSVAGETLGELTVAPGDIAVLARTRRQVRAIHGELVAAGVPAVIGSAGSVFATAAAADWQSLLQALERPSSTTRARQAAMTPFLGWDATRVALAGEGELEELHQRLHGWGRVLRDSGFAALTRTILSAEGVPERLLSLPDGERRLTDLGHVAELLHAESRAAQLGLTALAGWLRDRIAEDSTEDAADERTRRLDSDAAAVQVLTIHSSKGLEFPIVFCPFLWEPSWIPRKPIPVYFHEDSADQTRAIDVALEGGEYDAHKELYTLEQRGEDLRLAYVALTRARHQAVIWWAGSFSTRESPLTRLVFAQDEDGNVESSLGYTPSDENAFARFEEVAEAAPEAISVEWSRITGPVSWARPADVGGELRAAEWRRKIDSLWRRTSYSAITSDAHDARVGSEPEDMVPPTLDDEPAATDEGASERPPGSPPGDAVPLAVMAGGTRVGTLVHSAFEQVDFGAARLQDELAAALVVAGGTTGAAALECEPGVAAAGLALALATPLGGSLGDLALTGASRDDRLDELEFELPLAGGETPTGAVTVHAIADLLDDFVPHDDPLAGYAERLRDPALGGLLRGYLIGIIDLVLRVRGADGRVRYAVIDYKTNWLGVPGEPLTAWQYRPAALAEAMQRSDYVLQALLYSVALHRYLRWRVPDYDPGADLLGIHYLFVRGMLGSDPGTGVFSWRPPGGLVVALSDLLAGDAR